MPGTLTCMYSSCAHTPRRKCYSRHCCLQEAGPSTYLQDNNGYVTGAIVDGQLIAFLGRLGRLGCSCMGAGLYVQLSIQVCLGWLTGVAPCTCNFHNAKPPH